MHQYVRVNAPNEFVSFLDYTNYIFIVELHLCELMYYASAEKLTAALVIPARLRFTVAPTVKCWIIGRH